MFKYVLSQIWLNKVIEKCFQTLGTVIEAPTAHIESSALVVIILLKNEVVSNIQILCGKAVCTPSHDKTVQLSTSSRSQCIVRSRDSSPIEASARRDSFRFPSLFNNMTSEKPLKSLVLRCGCRRFWKSNVRLWIAQCDHAFTFSGISSDDTKYSALVANLDAETLSYVSDIVLSPPAVTNITLAAAHHPI
ncbi:hypothetical protein TNCV_3074871 [Trichonephila clavipes]|nr:hypothetical protein TNCV_3074871 [Trichonephila clavipes]